MLLDVLGARYNEFRGLPLRDVQNVGLATLLHDRGYLSLEALVGHALVDGGVDVDDHLVAHLVVDEEPAEAQLPLLPDPLR